MTVWTISFLVVTLVEGLIITAFERYLYIETPRPHDSQNSFSTRQYANGLYSYVFAKYAVSLPTDQLSNPANRFGAWKALLTI